MSSLQRIAFIGNHLPRRCGIATFTHDLHQAVSNCRPQLDTCVVAMTDPGRTYAYPPAVRFHIHDDVVGEYIQTAKFLNNSRFDAVCLQHEYGIFGGEAGANIVELISRLDMPVVTTLHTVLADPSIAQRRVITQINDISAKIVVMAEKGREFLLSIYNVPDRKIEVIPHGIPDFPYLDPHHAKEKLGFSERSVILTFGLLSPSKGIETVIDAMPDIVKSCPNALYVILGATHPNLVRDQGEAYRDSLTARVNELGVQDHVVFFDQFVGQATLLDFISMCDVYATPYLNAAQMTSGTLSYSFGLGKAVVSTPYWHAEELLSDGRGVLVPFGDVQAIGNEIAGLLTNDVRRDAMRDRAYAESRSMTWPQTAKRYLTCFEAAQVRAKPSVVVPIEIGASRRKVRSLPEMEIEHFLALCDSTGMLQHATHSVPNRAHGYCIDDNARALLLASELAGSDEAEIPEIMTTRFAAFVQHAWNPDTGRFRNFMSYDRQWLEASGSEDSHGRTLWALAECARKDLDRSRRRWATALFVAALPAVESFRSPRAWAFTLLGLDGFCAANGASAVANRVRRLLAEKLMFALSAAETKDWVWFEDVLAYDNARLPQALIRTGVAMKMPAYSEAGLRSLRWLAGLQTTSLGHFRPIGTQSFGAIRRKPEAFDQQPVEAAAMIAACAAAWDADGSAEWYEYAMRAFGWFLGENDLRATLIDPETGGCLDGLHPDRANENMGAESTLSYLLGLTEMKQFKQAVALGRTKPVSPSTGNAVGAIPSPRSIAGEPVVPISIPESASLVFAAGPGKGRRETVQAGDRTPRPESDR
jgi:glycosyltransferase involved in cell wall biosynthesis